MAENVHLKEMLVSQLDLIQLQSKTILSKDKQLKQLREEKIIYLRETFKKDNYFNLGGEKLSSTFVKIKLVIFFKTSLRNMIKGNIKPIRKGFIKNKIKTSL